MRTVLKILVMAATLALAACQSVGEREAVQHAEAAIWGARFEALGGLAVAFLAGGFAGAMSTRNTTRKQDARQFRTRAEAALESARRKLLEDRQVAERDRRATEAAFAKRAELESRAVVAFDRVRNRERLGDG